MTLVIGIRCRDGIVMAADSMSTEVAPQHSALIAKHESDKIVIQGGLLWGTSGAVGVRQIVEHIITDKYTEMYDPSWPAVIIRQSIINHIAGPVTQQYKIVAEASLGKGPLPHTNFIFGVYAQGGFHIINIECDMQGEVVDCPHCATGSGAKVGQALLRRLRNQDWDIRIGEVVAYRTMNDAIHIEPMGIGPPIKLARYYLDADKKPRLEMVAGAELKEVEGTAQLWTELEQNALANLGHSKAAEPPPAPSDTPPQ